MPTEKRETPNAALVQEHILLGSMPQTEEDFAQLREKGVTALVAAVEVHSPLGIWTNHPHSPLPEGQRTSCFIRRLCPGDGLSCDGHPCLHTTQEEGLARSNPMPHPFHDPHSLTMILSHQRRRFAIDATG